MQLLKPVMGVVEGDELKPLQNCVSCVLQTYYGERLFCNGHNAFIKTTGQRPNDCQVYMKREGDSANDRQA